MVVGDLHNIAAEVQNFDPHYHLKLNVEAGKYQVVERRQRYFKEGVLEGHPFYSSKEVEEVTMTIDYIDAEKQAPDMRIVHDLRKKDMWLYPGGPKAYYDDLMRESEQTREKMDRNFADNAQLQAEERHKYIVREHDGMASLKTVF